MTSLTGRIQEFRPEGSERFSTYMDRLSLYFDANSVADDKKVAVFLTVIGPHNYDLLNDHCVPPAKPKDKSLDELIDVLKRHYEPEPIVIAERFQFHKRDQRAKESIADFVADLRRLATTCDFTAEYLDQALRDRFVCGLVNETIQKRLLVESDLDMTKAVKLALSLEGADKYSRAMHGPAGVNVEDSNTGNSSSIKRELHTVRRVQRNCYRCGRSGHQPEQCRFKEATCHSCGKQGHIAPVCRSKPMANKTSNTKRNDAKFNGRKKDTRWVQVHTESDNHSSHSNDTTDFSILTLDHQSQPPISVEVKLNGQNVRMELDTGAALSLISEDTKKAVIPDIEVRHTDIILRTYTSETVDIVGQCEVTVTYESQVVQVPIIIVKGSGPSLIGRDWLAKIKFNWFTIKRTRCQQEELDALINNYPSVFNEGLGTMKNFTASLDIVPGAKPKFCRPRFVPFSIRDAVDQELQRLKSQNVIAKVNHSQWAAPIVAVPKKDGKIRICGDYKVTINPVMQIDQHPLPKPDDPFCYSRWWQNIF